MTEAVELPQVVVDVLRAERGGIVDFAIQRGKIVVIPMKSPRSKECEDRGEVEKTVLTDEHRETEDVRSKIV